MSIISQCASYIVEALTENLEEVEEAIKVIIEQEAPSSSVLPQLVTPEPQRPHCCELTIQGLRIGIPFFRTLLRTDSPAVSLPLSPGSAQVVKVLGRPESHKSEFLEVLAGRKAPTSGAIRFGSYESHERDRLAHFAFIPRHIPTFPRLKICELYREYLNFGPIPEDPYERVNFLNRLEERARRSLANFHLIKDIEIPGKEDTSGVNLLIGDHGVYLDEEQNRLLFYALQHEAIRERQARADYSFDPTLLIIDGIYLLRSWKHREAVLSNFKSVCLESHTTLVVALEDPNDVYDNDFVITVLAPSDFSQNQELEAERNRPQEEWSELISGGQRHATLYNHIDDPQRARYREFLACLKDGLSRSKRTRPRILH